MQIFVIYNERIKYAKSSVRKMYIPLHFHSLFGKTNLFNCLTYTFLQFFMVSILFITQRRDCLLSNLPVSFNIKIYRIYKNAY